MIGIWWQRSTKRSVGRIAHGSKAHVRGKSYKRLELEWLESRLTPATHTWTGATAPFGRSLATGLAVPRPQTRVPYWFSRVGR